MHMLERNCQCCGATFTARAADVRRGWAKFCSKRCKAMKQEARTGQHRFYVARVESASHEPRLCFPSHAEGDVQ